MRELMGDEVLDAVEKLKVVAAEAGLTTAQLAIAWVLRRPEVSSVIVGASSSAQLAENVAASGIRLDHDRIAAAEAIMSVAAV